MLVLRRGGSGTDPAFTLSGAFLQRVRADQDSRSLSDARTKARFSSHHYPPLRPPPASTPAFSRSPSTAPRPPRSRALFLHCSSSDASFGFFPRQQTRRFRATPARGRRRVSANAACRKRSRPHPPLLRLHPPRVRGNSSSRPHHDSAEWKIWSCPMLRQASRPASTRNSRATTATGRAAAMSNSDSPCPLQILAARRDVIGERACSAASDFRLRVDRSATPPYVPAGRGAVCEAFHPLKVVDKCLCDGFLRGAL